MKKYILILIILIIGAIGLLLINKQYAISDYKIPFFSVPKNHVRVDFVNNSDKNIKYILVFPNNIKIENIKVGERRTIIFEQKGESTYQFLVYFDLSYQIKVDSRYIEGGYFVTESIYNNEIKTEY